MIKQRAKSLRHLNKSYIVPTLLSTYLFSGLKSSQERSKIGSNTDFNCVFLFGLQHTQNDPYNVWFAPFRQLCKMSSQTFTIWFTIVGYSFNQCKSRFPGDECSGKSILIHDNRHSGMYYKLFEVLKYIGSWCLSST